MGGVFYSTYINAIKESLLQLCFERKFLSLIKYNVSCLAFVYLLLFILSAD